MKGKFFWMLNILIAVSLLSAPAFARSKKKKKVERPQLADVLGEIKWGDSKEDVLKKMKSSMKKGLIQKKGSRDMVALQRKRKAIMDRHAKAKKSYKPLSGDDTGYEVSVISDEFSSNNGEAFLQIKDKVAKRFFFFIDGRLYKLVVAYNSSYLKRTGFSSFVASSAQKYGRPAKAEYSEINGKDRLSLVRWVDRGTQLDIKNKRELFATYTMSFADRQVLKRFKKSKRNFGGNNKDEDELSSSVKSLMADSKGSANHDIVDGMTGNTKINLKDGRPVDANKQYDDEGNVVDTELAEAPKKKKKKKKKRKKKKKKTKNAPDFSKIKSGGDLVIY